jgi:dTDP-glucose 4,6-dehydratase
MRRSLRDSVGLVFNRNKCGYASDLTSIEKVLQELGQHGDSRNRLLRVDLADADVAATAVQHANPDLVLHLGTESQDDRSNKCPGACIKSDITGTSSLLQAERVRWEGLPARRRELNRIQNISTDEVLCSLGATGRFSETSTNALYDPSSLYLPSKTCSDHLMQDWHHTYGLPVVMTNCSNNYGSWQYLKKLSPVVILEAAAREPIPPYGDAQNVHDWLYTVENVDRLLLEATQDQLGHSNCVGGHGECTNKQVVEVICQQLDELCQEEAAQAGPIRPVDDKPNNDRRHATDPTRKSSEVGWQPRRKLEKGWIATNPWNSMEQVWCYLLMQNSGHSGQGVRNPP